MANKRSATSRTKPTTRYRDGRSRTRKRRPVRSRTKTPTRRAASPRAISSRFAGFDTGSYPGDAAIDTWAAQSPHRFVGFYFDAPCHTRKVFKTWSGKFPVIKASGLGLAIIYVGLQQDGCGRTKLSHAQGLEHGRDAIAKSTAEGFPDGAVVFLDIEHYDGPLSAAMDAYVRGWLSAMLDSGTVTSGIYCPASKANEIRLAAQHEFAAHGLPDGAPVFWIVKAASSFDPATSKPTDCGVPFASVWQGRLDTRETHGGVTITIDQNVADSRDPSRAT
jgi:glycoside hydrolase-like protein